MTPIRVLDLFSGIGGCSLGLRMAGGFETVGFCEIDPFCRRVLAKHWPGVWQHDDIRTLTAELVRERCGRVDLICGGFPCQPVSQNGRKKAQDDERWLWPEIARVLGFFQRPRPWLWLENVTGLLDRGIDGVLGDFARLGYDAEWDSIPAAAFGAPHLRERIMLVSYPASARLEGEITAGRIWGRGLLAQCDRWEPEPSVPRVANGLPDRVDRIKSLGNAVVPQVVCEIGEWIRQEMTQ